MANKKRLGKRNLFILLFLLVAALLTGFQFTVNRTVGNQAGIIDEVTDNGLVYSLINQKGAGEYADMLVIDRQTVDGKRQRIYENHFNDLKPWKLEIADVDGDGQKEILVAVHKSTHFDPQEKNRLFIFNYGGGKLYKKWTGSRIAGVWNNFYAGNILPIPGDELIFTQQTEDNRQRISIYYWFNFGFGFLAESDAYPEVKDLAIIGENRLRATIIANGKEETRTLMVKNGKIIEVVPNL